MKSTEDHILYYEDEVRAFKEGPTGKGTTDRELELATQPIHQLQSKTWNPSRYPDTYREPELALIKKSKGVRRLLRPSPHAAVARFSIS